MASLDFDKEKIAFRKYYDNNRQLFEGAKNAYISRINFLIKQSDIGEVTKIEGRVKDKFECIKKFHRKYQNRLESEEQPYEIKDYITDLIGIRIVCLYEDQIAAVASLLQQHFKIIDVTDKISEVEGTEDSFGYKGLHMDLALQDELDALPKYRPYLQFSFEVQIRSLIQDAWSVLDHKIKYKKSIPSDLKRRINLLSALFELADREFKEIRNATDVLLQQATDVPVNEQTSKDRVEVEPLANDKIINAFNFLRVAGHFFQDFDFEDYKVDGFVQDILKSAPQFKRSDLHDCLIENFKTVRDYQTDFLATNPGSTFSPYTAIRHCLYLFNPKTFQRILSEGSKNRFIEWLDKAIASTPL
ncbi:MAG TPA: (p)ppGpp synthetase [Malonomonas sp.]